MKALTPSMLKKQGYDQFEEQARDSGTPRRSWLTRLFLGKDTYVRSAAPRLCIPPDLELSAEEKRALIDAHKRELHAWFLEETRRIEEHYLGSAWRTTRWFAPIVYVANTITLMSYVTNLTTYQGVTVWQTLNVLLAVCLSCVVAYTNGYNKPLKKR